jgi:cobalt-zinc-cadmium resistance protein CzcA
VLDSAAWPRRRQHARNNLRENRACTRFQTKEALIASIDQALAAIPGIAYNFSQPMEMRMDETVSGVKADLAVKVFGDDFGILDSLGQQVLRSMSRVRGAADAQMLLTTGVAELSIRVDRAALARYGLNVTDVEEAVSAGGSGDVISTVVDGQKRYGVALHLPNKYRTPC